MRMRILCTRLKIINDTPENSSILGQVKIKENEKQECQSSNKVTPINVFADNDKSNPIKRHI